MAAAVKAQILEAISKILSDVQLIKSVLENLKDEVQQLELVDTKHDVQTPEIVSAVSASEKINLDHLFDQLDREMDSNTEHQTPEIVSAVSASETVNLDHLFDQLDIDHNEYHVTDSEAAEYDDDDDEENQAWACSIRDICDYDSDTGICEY